MAVSPTTITKYRESLAYNTFLAIARSAGIKKPSEDSIAGYPFPVHGGGQTKNLPNRLDALADVNQRAPGDWDLSCVNG